MAANDGGDLFDLAEEADGDKLRAAGWWTDIAQKHLWRSPDGGLFTLQEALKRLEREKRGPTP